MTALGVIKQVENLGGKLFLDNEGQLKLAAPEPLPAEVLEAVSAEKPAIMVALGAPLDAVVSNILDEIRPHLPASLKRLPDDKLLALVNWSIITAWSAAVRKAA